MFGGLDINRKANNELRFVKIGKKPVDILLVKQKGSVPTPRTSSSLNYYETLNVLILFGGKNEKLEKVYNDLYVFDLDLFVWVRVNLFDQVPGERAEHSAVVYKDKYIIFGGININNYLGSDFNFVNLSKNE